MRAEPCGVRTRDRRFVFRAFILVLLCGALQGCSVATFSGGERSETVVHRITDGDAVNILPEVRDNSTVRLIGVDTPERGEPLYEEAAAFAEDNLEGERVALELDAEEVDDYGRLLAYVYQPDGSMFNEALVREGYAQVATFPPNTRYLDRFEKAQGEAREAGRSIWGLTEGEACQLRERGNGIGGGYGG
jgi:micrococcal nuclease